MQVLLKYDVDQVFWSLSPYIQLVHQSKEGERSRQKASLRRVEAGAGGITAGRDREGLTTRGERVHLSRV